MDYGLSQGFPKTPSGSQQEN